MAASRAPRRRLAAVLVSVVLGAAATARGAEAGLCAAVEPAGPPILLLSAFPAELVPVIAATTVEATIEAEGYRYHVGRLAGMRVVLGLTGIGILNAAATADSAIRSFAPAGILMSAVAGSHHRIGDVVIVRQWVEEGRGRVFRINPAMLQLARQAALALPESLHTCTRVPPMSPDGEIVCMAHQPSVFFERRGRSGDPFNGPFPCIPGGNEIIGCELPPASSGATRTPDVEDMESAAVARVAARYGVPFIAMRAVSDGAGDPLGDRGFPAQFFDYYRLAAENASIVTHALLAELGRLAADPSAARICQLLDDHRWRRAAARMRTASGVRGP